MTTVSEEGFGDIVCNINSILKKSRMFEIMLLEKVIKNKTAKIEACSGMNEDGRNELLIHTVPRVDVDEKHQDTSS